MQDYIADDWKQTLQENNLQCFDDWWGVDAEWYEPPNRCRGGWSGVSRLELGDRVVFLKRQENHLIRTLAHPFRGIPTFTREMQNITTLHEAKIPALTAVYFAQRNINGVLRAILVTEALEGFVPLSTITPSQLSMPKRIALIKAVAGVVKNLHQHKIVHNCLYPKHLFIKENETGFVVKLIDLEKARKRWHRYRAVFRDLDTLNRHCSTWSLMDRVRFLKEYITDAATWRKLWHSLAERKIVRYKRGRDGKS